MDLVGSLKRIWKKLGVTGQVKNFSSVELWVVNTEKGTVARKLAPGFKTPPKVDIDGFKRVDGLAIDGHKNWWKIYDGSIAEVTGKDKLQVSVITKVAVEEVHFGEPRYINEAWGEAIKLITDVRRSKKGRITAYNVTGLGWVKPQEALRLTCYHEIDNARPVFPEKGMPYIRTRRDPELLNNLSKKGRS